MRQKRRKPFRISPAVKDGSMAISLDVAIAGDDVERAQVLEARTGTVLLAEAES